MNKPVKITGCALLFILMKISANSQDAVPAVGALDSQPPAIRVLEVFGEDGGFAFPVATPVIPGSVLDLSYLNDERADRKITVIDGRYAYADNQEPLRFFGVNLCVNSAMPSYERADATALRLAQLGVNIVRLHHIDNMWARTDGGSLWPADGSMDRLDPDALDRMGYLIAALKEKGIYCNLNLKVSKELGPEDGVPAGAEYVHQKRVDRFFPALIDHQKWYAEILLNWRNPHTGMTLAEDPAIALVEINNENSIMHLWPGQPLGEGWEELGEPYRDVLQNMWRDWLEAKYKNDEALRNAWLETNSDNKANDGEVVPVAGPWIANGLSGTVVDLKQSNGNLLFKVQNSTGTDWHAQALWQGVPLTSGNAYTLELVLSANSPREVRVSADRDSDGTYSNVGLDRVLKVERKPQTFELSFRANNVDASNRIALNMGAGIDGQLSVHRAELRHGRINTKIQGSLAEGGFSIFGPRTPAQQQDWLSFLVEVERNFSQMMRSYLRNELGIDKPIADSQVQWGGSSAYEREGYGQPGGSDFVDTHAYWNHPSFTPGKDWDSGSWTFGNESIIEAINRGQSALIDLAAYRLQGYPFGVSELDQSSPSDWAAELLPVMSTFASAQDWDALYLFSGDDPGNHPNQGIRGYFEQLAHTSKAGQYPAAALMFRRALIPNAPQRTLSVNSPLWPNARYPSDAWRIESGENASPDKLLSYRHEISLLPGSIADEPNLFSDPDRSSPLAFHQSDEPFYSAVGERAIAIVGFLGRSPISLGEVVIDPSNQGLNFGALTLISLDEKSLKESNHLLLTIIGRAQNQDMGWNAERTSVGNKWGHGPMLVQIPRVKIELPNRGYKAWSLTPQGERKSTVHLSDGDRVIEIHPKHESIYFEIQR